MEKLAVSEFADVISGATPDTSIAKFWNGKIDWITPVDLSKLSTRFIFSSIRKISIDGLNSCATTILPAGSVVMSSRAPIGYFAIGQTDFTTNQGCKSFLFKKKQDSEFHYYSFLFNVEKFKQLGAGSTFAEISKAQIEKIVFDVPPLHEQQKIAKILRTVDGQIEKTEAIIAKYKAIKQGLMQDLFTRGIDVATGKLRPCYQDAPELYKPSPLGMIPKEWEIDILVNQCFRSGAYGINAASVPFSHSLPTYLRITDITDEGKFAKEDKRSVNSPESSKYLLSIGDIVFARTGATVGKTYLYNPADGPLVFAGFLIKFSPDFELLLSSFLKYYTETPAYLNWVQIMSMRSGQPGINGNEYGKMLLPLPDIDEQKVISKTLDANTEIIDKETANLKKLQQLKKGLMADLLSGKVRVQVDEEAVC